MPMWQGMDGKWSEGCRFARVPGATSQQLPSLQGLPLWQKSGGAGGRDPK